MLDEYYKTLGWDVESGLPSPEFLTEQGLGYLLEISPNLEVTEK
jgi:aldehyde:ferredoxin oxidoreductase